MTATIDQLIDEQPGRGESKESGVSTELELWNALFDDLTDMRTKFGTLLTQLDAEGTLGGGYVSGNALATATLAKGT
jgi:hypothetical protein